MAVTKRQLEVLPKREISMSTINASNTSEFLSALRAAKPGDTIQLASGTYSNVVIKGLNISGDINITSADAGKPAVLTDMQVLSSSGLNFSNLEFKVDPNGASNPFRVTDSKDIHFNNLNVHGSLDGTPSNDTAAMLIRTSSDVSVTNSEFQQLSNGLSQLDNNGLTISGNSFHDIRIDGVRGGGSSNVTITKNFFTDFYRQPGDHPDAIQFWTTNTTTPGKNITVTDNVFVRGDGTPVQGVFMKDEVGNLPFENVKISGNMIIGAAYNGISIKGGKNVEVVNNTVLGFSDMSSWYRMEDVSGIKMSGNVGTKYFGDVNVTGKTGSGNETISLPGDQGLALLKAWYGAHSGLHGDLDEYLGATPPTGPVDPGPVDPPLDPGPVDPPLDPGPVDPPLDPGPVDPPVYPVDPPPTTEVPSGKPGIIVEGSGNGTFKGSAGDDVLTSGNGKATLIGGAGNDTYVVNSFAKVVEAADGGIDTVKSMYSTVLSDNVENLTITGSGGASGTGNALDNVINGNGGANRLDGGAGNDTINGGAGNDIIWGKAGNDLLTGGTGADQFRFEAGSGRDVITDFGANGDRDSLDFSAYGKAGAKVALVDAGSDLIVVFDDQSSVLLKGVQIDELSFTGSGFFIN